MHTLRLLIALGALAVTGWAQSSAGLAGPVTGFVFDAQAGAVRPMLGIPGAAYLGNVVAAGLQAASVSPNGSAALAVQQGGKLVLYSGLRTALPVTLAVSGAIAGADHFAWGPGSGTAADLRRQPPPARPATSPRRGSPPDGVDEWRPARPESPGGGGDRVRPVNPPLR